LAATRRQLAAAEQESSRLASQLAAGLASAGGSGGEGASGSGDAGPAGPSTPARLQEITKQAEEEMAKAGSQLANVSLAHKRR
jgi:hypothetical protein